MSGQIRQAASFVLGTGNSVFGIFHQMSLPADTLAGSTLVIIAGCSFAQGFAPQAAQNSGIGSPAPTGDATNGIYTASDIVTDSTGLSSVGMFYKQNASVVTAGTLFTMNLSGSADYNSMYVMEVTGVTSSSVLGHSAAITTVAGAGTDTVSTGTAALGSGSVFMVAGGYGSNHASLAGAGSASTSFDTTWDFGTGGAGGPLFRIETLRVSSPGTLAQFFSPTTADTFIALMIGFAETPTVPVLGTTLPTWTGPGVSPFKLNAFVARPLSQVTADVTLPMAGQSIITAGGVVAPGTTDTLTGAAITTVVGSAGFSLAGLPLGQALTSTAGSLPGASKIGIGGQTGAFASGTLTVTGNTNVSVTLNGQVLTSAPGHVAANGDVVVSLTAQAITSGIGALIAQNGELIAGQILASASGSLGIAASMTFAGQPVASATGIVSPSTGLGVTGQPGVMATGILPPSWTLAVTGQAMPSTAGGVSLPAFGTGTTWDSGTVTWDSSFQLWDGATIGAISAPMGQINPTGPGVGPDYNRMFSWIPGDTSILPATVYAPLTGAQSLTATGAIFAQVNSTLTLTLTGQSMTATTGQTVPSFNVTAALTGTPISASTGAIKYAPTYGTDPEYTVSLAPRAFTAQHPTTTFTVSIGPRSFTVVGS